MNNPLTVRSETFFDAECSVAQKCSFSTPSSDPTIQNTPIQRSMVQAAAWAEAGTLLVIPANASLQAINTAVPVLLHAPGTPGYDKSVKQVEDIRASGLLPYHVVPVYHRYWETTPKGAKREGYEEANIGGLGAAPAKAPEDYV